MANVAQGITVTWNSVALGEVVSVSVDGLSADVVEVTDRTATDRSKAYSAADVDYGTVSCTVRGTAAMSSTNVRLTGSLSISGPGVAWSFSKAIMQSLGWSAAVGDMQTYTVTFKLGS